MKSFNRIMGSFKKTVAKLEKLEEMNINSKIKIDAQINEMSATSDALMQEAAIAAKTADKIRKFYEVD